MSGFLRVAWIVLRKDLTVEVRSREVVYTTLFFAVSCVLVFAFALVKEGRALEDAAAGDRLCGHAGTRPHLRARTAVRDAARASACPGGSPGDIRRQACGYRRAAPGR
jgi:hypothetical protein